MADANEHLADEVRELRTSVASLAEAVAKIPDTVRATIDEMFPATETDPGPSHAHVPVEG